MLRFDPRYKNISPKPALDFLWIGTLEEQLDCLSQVGSRLFDRRPLTSHVQLGAQRGVRISLLLDDLRVHRSHSILPAATEMPWPVNDSIPEIRHTGWGSCLPPQYGANLPPDAVAQYVHDLYMNVSLMHGLVAHHGHHEAQFSAVAAPRGVAGHPCSPGTACCVLVWSASGDTHF